MIKDKPLTQTVLAVVVLLIALPVEASEAHIALNCNRIEITIDVENGQARAENWHLNNSPDTPAVGELVATEFFYFLRFPALPDSSTTQWEHRLKINKLTADYLWLSGIAPKENSDWHTSLYGHWLFSPKSSAGKCVKS